MGPFGQISSADADRQHRDERSIRRLALIVAFTGLAAALMSLPLPTLGASPDVSAILAILAVAVIAGHRWALPLLCVLDGAMMFVWAPTLYAQTPIANLEYACLLATCLLAVPGVVTSMRVGPLLGEFMGLGNAFRRTTHILAPVALVILAMAIGVM